MSFDTLGDVNYLAALVAAVGWALLAAIWFAPPVFGGASSEAYGWKQPDRPPSPIPLVGSLLIFYLAAVVTAWIARETGAETVTDGIVLGLAVGVGYAMAITAAGAIWEPKPRPGVWFSINALANLLGLVIVAAIVTVWD